MSPQTRASTPSRMAGRILSHLIAKNPSVGAVHCNHEKNDLGTTMTVGGGAGGIASWPSNGCELNFLL